MRCHRNPSPGGELRDEWEVLEERTREMNGTEYSLGGNGQEDGPVERQRHGNTRGEPDRVATVTRQSGSPEEFRAQIKAKGPVLRTDQNSSAHSFALMSTWFAQGPTLMVRSHGSVPSPGRTVDTLDAGTVILDVVGDCPK